MIEMEDDGTEAKFKQLFEQVQQGESLHKIVFSSYLTMVAEKTPIF